MILSFRGAAVDPLWSNLNLELERGEFLAVLGPNGVGKSTLIGTVLGTRSLTSGTVSVSGRIGLIPQQRMFPPDLPMRGRDLVSLAVNPRPFGRTEGVDKLLDFVGARSFADQRVGTLSGGQQQLIRQAQAFAQDPELLLADEPLLSLDPARQHETTRRLKDSGAAVVCVTHSINPLLSVVDRVLYIGPQGHVLGSVDEVMRSEVLSDLFGTHVDVAEVNGKLVVL
ncbi:metal ABC transporter ATP-binding protein [Corynebacterium sp. Q4381]|uniref:metal ABC transporter ATP-binding protein n=1 Tax=Corynebacterium sp. Marseille-Q4381 TaxID=3121597 RepID=UPI002FE5B42D